MKISNRNLHRDFAYFYVGLIIAFAFSGIILNHRRDWYPMDYIYEIKDVQVDLPQNDSSLTEISEETIVAFSEGWDLKYDDHRINEGSLRVFYRKNAILDLDIATGTGKLEHKRKVPFLGHTMYLHKSTDVFWIWYSDIFGVAMLLIAITGMLIPIGKNGFKTRGWKLALAGLVFPFIFLFILS